MKKSSLFILLLLLWNLSFSQSLIIYKTDQTSVHFNLSAVDSITFSTTPRAQILDASNLKCHMTEPVLEKGAGAGDAYENAAEGVIMKEGAGEKPVPCYSGIVCDSLGTGISSSPRNPSRQ